MALSKVKIVAVIKALLTDWSALASGGLSVIMGVAGQLVGADAKWLFWLTAALAFGFALYRAGYLHRNVADALARPLTLHEAAVYLRDRSVWGRRKRHELHLWREVESAVAHALTVAAGADRIHPSGRHPNSAQVEPINRGYWAYNGIDEQRIWDPRNETGTFHFGAVPAIAGLEAYQDIMIPASEVYSTWPPMLPGERLVRDAIFTAKAKRRGWASELDHPTKVISPEERRRRFYPTMHSSGH